MTWILKKFNGTKQNTHLYKSINDHNNQSTFMQHLTTHARKKVQTVLWSTLDRKHTCNFTISKPNNKKKLKKCVSTESNQLFFPNTFTLMHLSRSITHEHLKQDSPLCETTGKQLMSIHCVWTTDGLTFICATCTHLTQRMMLLHSTCQSLDVWLNGCHL